MKGPDDRAIILLERSEIGPAMRVLNLIRAKSQVGEVQRTWALVKLYCIWRFCDGKR